MANTALWIKYVPDGDYVVIKFARWAFEKFKGVEDKLGTQMRAVGEVMSIGKNLQRGIPEGNPKPGEWQLRSGSCEGFRYLARRKTC